MSMSNFKSLTVKGGEYGFYCEDIWMMNWKRCSAYSKCGFYIGTGTSNTFDTCWSKDTKTGYSSYRIHNLVYSTLKIVVPNTLVKMVNLQNLHFI